MALDMRTSRRTKFERCVYYGNTYTSQAILAKKAKPAGVFYAQVASPETVGKIELGNIIRRDSSSFTLITQDIVDIKVDYWVVMGGKLYIVEDVSSDTANKSRMKSNRPFSETRIGIRK